MFKGLIGRFRAPNSTFSVAAEAEQVLRDWNMECRDAATSDANLARLMATDPDAAMIFDRGDFTRCLNDIDGFGTEFGRRLEAYATAKLAAGRMGLYYQLFAGASD